MSYELSDVKEYSYTDTTFGATSVTHQIIGPRGKVGFVREISVDISAAMVGTSTVPEIDVGISSGDATYGRYRLGATAIAGYTTGMHRASQENWTGNPPRIFADYPNHVVLDGGPLDTATGRIPIGRIPASGLSVANVIAGTGSVARIYLNQQLDPNVKPGQLVQTRGIGGATATGMTAGTLVDGFAPISALSSTANTSNTGNWIELGGTTFGGTYTSGGSINFIALITCAAGVGGTPAGGGQVRVEIQWVGAETP